MITIYAATNLPPMLIGAVRDIRAVWAAEELRLPYQLHWLDAKAGEHRADWFRAFNPFQKFPAIEDGGTALFESGAIVAYLADKARRMIPPPGALERTQHDQWIYAAVNTIEPSMFDLFVCGMMPADMPGLAERRERSMQQAKERLAALDKVFHTRAYTTGDDFAAADIVMAHVLTFGRDESLFDGLDMVKDYLRRCTARPAYQKALAIQTAGKPANAA